VTITRNLLDGLGQMLAANGTAAYLDAYPTDFSGWAATVGPKMPQSPSKLIVLTPYIPGGAAGTDAAVFVQARYRGTSDPNDANDKADEVYALWQDLAQVNVGGVNVEHVYRVSQTPNGTDGNDRTEIFQNWAWAVSWPTPRRFD
jgi:hypothetical protein